MPSTVAEVLIKALKAGYAWADLKEAVLFKGREPMNSSVIIN